MEAISTLAGVVAHDLNNILSGIVCYPELLLLDLPQNSPLVEPILTIRESGQKAAAIVQDLLTPARRGVAGSEVMNINHTIYDYLMSPEYEKLKSLHPQIQVETNLDADLLVLDMIMPPGIDGLETYKRVLAHHPGQKAIIASGFSETELVKEAQSLGGGRIH